MEGANLSGDLKDPAHSIPRGTMGALTTAVLSYLVLIISFGGSFDREVLRDNLTVFQDACLGSK